MISLTFLHKTFIFIAISHYLISTGVSVPSNPLANQVNNDPSQAPFSDPSFDPSAPTPFESPSRPFRNGPYFDLPRTYVFDQKFDWEHPGGMPVYDANGVITYIITNKVNGTSIGMDFVIQDPPNKGGAELIRVNMHKPSCWSAKHIFHTSANVFYQWNTRFWAPDRWHIHSENNALMHEDYVYRRKAGKNVGSIKIGHSEKRVAKIFREHVETGWQKDKIGEKADTWVLRTNGEIHTHILLGLIVTSDKVYDHCNP